MKPDYWNVFVLGICTNIQSRRERRDKFMIYLLVDIWLVCTIASAIGVANGALLILELYVPVLFLLSFVPVIIIVKGYVDGCKMFYIVAAMELGQSNQALSLLTSFLYTTDYGDVFDAELCDILCNRRIKTIRYDEEADELVLYHQVDDGVYTTTHRAGKRSREVYDTLVLCVVGNRRRKDVPIITVC